MHNILFLSHVLRYDQFDIESNSNYSKTWPSSNTQGREVINFECFGFHEWIQGAELGPAREENLESPYYLKKKKKLRSAE